jgi:hypothetical protein
MATSIMPFALRSVRFVKACGVTAGSGGRASAAFPSR